MSKKYKLCALGMLLFFGIGLVLFIIAGEEQSINSSASARPDRLTLQQFPEGPYKPTRADLADSAPP